jgi:hypothetical protein
MHELQEQARAAGRDPVPITVYGAKPDDVEAYAAAGAHRCVFWLPPRGSEETVSRLEELAVFVGSYPVR